MNIYCYMVLNNYRSLWALGIERRRNRRGELDGVNSRIADAPKLSLTPLRELTLFAAGRIENNVLLLLGMLVGYS